MKLTFADAKNSRLPDSIGACADDVRFRDVLNEALERLMYEGHWHNTVQRVRFCATDGCITQPPQIATIEKVAICGQPVTLRTQWHEFMDNGWGTRNATQNCSSNSSSCSGSPWNGWCSGSDGLPRGYFPTFSDITGTNKKVILVCDLLSDVGKEVLVLGYDENGNWIRTIQDGSIQDGEIILLAQSGGTTSTNFFSAITDIQFNEARDGQTWLYELNSDTSVQRMIGVYQAFETRPNYARFYFAGIISGTSSGGSCNQTMVEALVKLNFWPVKVDTDYLCIPCLPALKDFMMALNAAENEPNAVEKVRITTAGLASAKSILNSQLQHFTGDGAVPTITVLGSSIYADNPIANLV